LSRKNTPLPASKGVCFLIAVIVPAVAVAAVNGTVLARAEGDLGFCSAIGTDCVEHFPRLIVAVAATVVALLAGRPTFRAAARIVSEAFLGEEVLLRGGENELGAAVPAG
jgi:hypothetical protein